MNFKTTLGSGGLVRWESCETDGREKGATHEGMLWNNLSGRDAIPLWKANERKSVSTPNRHRRTFSARPTSRSGPGGLGAVPAVRVLSQLFRFLHRPIPNATVCAANLTSASPWPAMAFASQADANHLFFLSVVTLEDVESGTA